jgi:predicted RNA methylase
MRVVFLKATARQNKKHKAVSKIIASFLTDELSVSFDAEKAEVLEGVKSGLSLMFPYEFTKKYRMEKIQVYADGKSKYVLHENKKMYFPDDWDKERIQGYYTCLLIEQDPDSPHRYETDSFCVQNGDVIADLGAAEGIWALSNVEKAKKIYLFECDEKWIKALQKTFEPWTEKVQVVNKFVSDASGDNTVTIDDFFDGGEVNMMKADIEGAEAAFLAGAEKTLSNSKKLKLAICTYHKHNDAADFEKLLRAKNFSVDFSKGYMILELNKDLAPPYVRRGVMRAKKLSTDSTD